MRKLVLWGHQADEYREMFDLSAEDMQGRLLEYGCGPSRVNSELTHLSQSIVSCDPLFALDKDILYSKVQMTFADMLEQVKKNQDKFNFSRDGSLDALVTRRRKGMDQFFADYDKGKKEKRYLAVSDDDALPFPDFSFDLALSAHYLFADLQGQEVDFHLKIIKELARVAKEVRIFPLIDRHGQPSVFLGPVLLGLQQVNLGVEVREVSYHLQSSGNAMLRIWPQSCRLQT